MWQADAGIRTVETQRLSNKETQMKTFTVSEQAQKGIPLTFNPEGDNELLGIPLGQGILKEMFDLHGPAPMKTTWNMLDVVPDETQVKLGVPLLRLIKEQNIRDNRALVHVETAAGIGGTVKLFANTVSERFDEKRGRVIREANEFPPLGVKLLATKAGACGPEFLIEMAPGASFRIVRSGRLECAKPELVVLWNGRWDRRAEYDKFRNPDFDRYEQYKTGQLRKSDFNKNDWDSLLYKDNPMKFWGLSVYGRSTRHGGI